jgi:iron complex transport system substrate-binding protein
MNESLMMKSALKKSLAGLALALVAASSHAITVNDDLGLPVTLAKPAQRIISLSPHVTELLFAVGGGARILGTMNYSDYPEEAKKIPLIGSNSQIDIEKVLALKPDLIVVWQSGNTARQLEQLSRLGIPVFNSEPKKMDDIATSLTRLGVLLGTEATAQAAAQAFRGKLATLASQYSKRPPVRVFFQIWDKPIYTLGGNHIVNDAITLCGGENIFASQKTVAPAVSFESVLQENPEVIIGGSQYDPADAGINIWKPYKTMLAVKQGNMVTMAGESLTRSGPRMVDGTHTLCEKIDLARQRRK